jgi:glycosyltransferase involved in cell wall biosynthesis
MKVSVITVCFNSAATLRDTIESVLAQSGVEVEYIVVDGASTDGTLDILDDYRDQIATIISEPDEGIYDAMNKGIAASTGDVIGILNSDDIFAFPDTVANVVAVFQQQPNTDVVFGDVVFVSPDDLSSVKRHYSSKRFRPWKLRFGYMPPHPGTFVRREAYERVGTYRLDYRISADYEMFIRLLFVARLPYRRIDKVLVHMRPGGLSTSGLKSSVRLNREIIKACIDNGMYTNWLFLLPKVPFKLMELVRRPRTKTT